MNQPPTTIRAISRTLGERLGSPHTVDAFSLLRKIIVRERAVKWGPERDFLPLGGTYLRIFPIRGNSEKWTLQVERMSTRRLVARGSRESLRGLAEKLIEDCGPYGGGDQYFGCEKDPPPGSPEVMDTFEDKSDFILPAKRGPRKMMPYWQQAKLNARGWADQDFSPVYEEHSTFGSGFVIQRRWFPGKGYRVLYESPSGKLMLSYIEVADEKDFVERFDDYLYLHDRVEVNQPWVVRYASDLMELRGTQLPGIIGYAQKHAREVFLCELGWQDYALILGDQFEGGRAYTCVARGRADELADLQLCRGPELYFVPKLGKFTSRRPKPWKLKAFQTALEGLGLSPTLHTYVKAVVAQATAQVGAQSFRQLLWALLLAHLDGARGVHRKTTANWCSALCKYGYMDEQPGDEARRHTKKLMGRLSFVEAEDRGFMVNFDRLRTL